MKSEIILKPRLLLAGLILLAVLITALLFYFLGYENTWKLWNLPTKMPPFFDLRLITGSAESYAAGNDPMFHNPLDPAQRYFNYPRIWYLILASGINQGWTIPTGVGLAAIFLLSVILFPGDLTSLSSVWIFLGVISPAVMFGLERENVDLTFFILLAFALILMGRSVTISMILFFVAVVFKIFPILGLGYLFGPDKRHSIQRVILGAGLAGFYFLITFQVIIRIFATTQQGPDYSYGVAVLPLQIAEILSLTKASEFSLRIVFTLVGIAIAILPALIGISQHMKFRAPNLQNLRAFWIGAGIYIGTFLLGNNWDYRLMFLLFVIPQILEWAGQKGGRLHGMARTSLVLIFLALYYFFSKLVLSIYLPHGESIAYFFDQAVDWTLFGSLIYLYAGSLPQWLYEEGGRLLQKVSLFGNPESNRE
jgi:hypothetical protein